MICVLFVLEGGRLGGCSGVSSAGHAAMLLGRETELEMLRGLVDRSRSYGDAFLFSGAPGVGKTVLLDAAADFAADAGMRVLRGAGTEFEVDLSFAGLNQVLHPLGRPSQGTGTDSAVGSLTLPR
jgi:AAA ATPase domain